MTEEVFSTEELQDYMRSYVEKNTQLESPKFHITQPCKKGDNYMGIIYRVTIEGIENCETKNIDLIVKTMRKNGTVDDIDSRIMFRNEISFYTKILPIFQKTINKKNGDPIVRCPYLYDFNIEIGKEMLILENLNLKGFVMTKSKIMDYPHLSLAMRCLGEFHAYSFLTRDTNPIGFEKFKPEKRWYDPNNNPLFFNKLDRYSKVFCNVLRKVFVADEDEHYTKKFVRFIDNLDREMYDAIDGKQAEPYAVVIHGDFWTNNMLFKYDQKGKPCDMRFIDFQVNHYVSPVIDIVYMLFCCCTSETRSKYYDQLIHEYHDALSKCLKSFGCDSNKLFPFEVLSQHLLKFGKYAAGIATICFPKFFNDSEDTSESHIFARDVLENKLETNSFFRNNAKSIFKDLIDKKYI